MSISYQPWKSPSEANLNYLGQNSTVNPGEGSVPPFRGQSAQTEIGEHGSFDSPENTAQTSPATITMACKISMSEWESTIKKIQSHRQRVVMIVPHHESQTISIEEAYRVEKAYSLNDEYSPKEGLGNSESTVILQAVALTGSRTGGETTLISLFPLHSKSISAINKSEDMNRHDCYPNVGVLMSHIAEKSAGIIHITLAVEHAVEAKLKYKNTYSKSNVSSRASGTFLPGSNKNHKETSVSGHIISAEPLLFKWFSPR